MHYVSTVSLEKILEKNVAKTLVTVRHPSPMLPSYIGLDGSQRRAHITLT